MMSKIPAAAALLLALSLAPGAYSQTDKAAPSASSESKKSAPQTKTDNDTKAVELLRRLEQRYANIRTIAGEFQQVRFDPTFDEKVESRASFHIAKPDKFRVDYQPPYAETHLITDRTSYRYVPKLNQCLRYRFKNQNTVQDLNFLLLGFGVHTEDLLRVYSVKHLGVQKGYAAIRLLPLDKKGANFKSVTIQLTNDANLYPAQFSMEQLDGVQTTANLDMRKLAIGAQFDEKRLFRPSFPVRPIDVE